MAEAGVGGEALLQTCERTRKGGVVTPESAGNAASRDPTEATREICGQATASCGLPGSAWPREDGDRNSALARHEFEHALEVQRGGRRLRFTFGLEALRREAVVSDHDALDDRQILRNIRPVDDVGVTPDGARPRGSQERQQRVDVRSG
ncbi:MAG TPA: hypothetical protein VMQ61_16120 [Thermoanaerobaculia bacterium]|nr:hypothetical protein [Thermoanaerobaculia bacterium]